VHSIEIFRSRRYFRHWDRELVIRCHDPQAVFSSGLLVPDDERAETVAPRGSDMVAAGRAIAGAVALQRRIPAQWTETEDRDGVELIARFPAARPASVG
jgi:hypothetical protein